MGKESIREEWPKTTMTRKMVIAQEAKSVGIYMENITKVKAYPLFLANPYPVDRAQVVGKCSVINFSSATQM